MHIVLFYNIISEWRTFIMKKEKTTKNYAKRTAKYFNFWRKLFQKIVTNIWYGVQFKLIYRLKVEGT